jgi:hypothetical protein
MNNVLPVARIDLQFDDPAEILRTAVKAYLPQISGDPEDMKENVEEILKAIGGGKMSIAITETNDGVSIIFMREGILEVPKNGLI